MTIDPRCLSTRPACPVCKQGTLVSWLYHHGDGYLTECQNPSCLAYVFLDAKQQVLGAEQHYWPDGSLVGSEVKAKKEA